MERMAQAISKSNLFGMKDVEQALALMLVAQAEGLHPATAARDYHIIQGRPALKADAMLARYLNSGGKVEWHEHTDSKVAATFSHPQGGTLKIDWDTERAKKAGLGGKDNWAKYPRQMLRARVISEGVRATNPAVAVGVYTIEETQDFEPADKPGRGKRARPMGEAHIITEPATPQAPSPAVPLSPAGDAAKVSLEQAMDLAQALADCDKRAEAAFLKVAKIERLDNLLAVDYAEALDWVKRRKAKAELAEQA
jgi:hypothetical protein